VETMQKRFRRGAQEIQREGESSPVGVVMFAKWYRGGVCAFTGCQGDRTAG
jgi:hypothetical protein